MNIFDFLRTRPELYIRTQYNYERIRTEWDFMEYLHNHNSDPLFFHCIFPWDSTNEGRLYWGNVSHRWNIYLKGISINKNIRTL